MTRYLCAWVLLVCGLLGAACGPGPVTLAEDTGYSVHGLKETQVLRPQRSPNLTPVVGLDGVAAAVAYQQYLKSFDRSEEAKAAGTGNISNISGSVGGQPPMR